MAADEHSARCWLARWRCRSDRRSRWTASHPCRQQSGHKSGKCRKTRRLGKDVKEVTDVWIEAKTAERSPREDSIVEVLRDGWCASRLRQPDGRPWPHVWRTRGWITGLVRLRPPATAGCDSSRSDRRSNRSGRGHREDQERID